ncbi:MAG: hypothetical protein OHK0039_26580 [Bacteroidia bacterium]
MSRLLKIFRTEKAAVWNQLSAELGAEFVPGKGWRHDQVRIRQQAWTIILETYKRGRRPVHTCIRAPYVNRDSFEFRIFRRTAVHSVAKIAGMQDIEIGFPAFDKAFIIQGNDAAKLRKLFENDRIRQLIQWQPDIWLENDPDEDWVIDTWREGISELRFQVPGVITDLQRLYDLYDLFAELLNHLCHIGSAYEDDPLIGA